MKKHILFVDHAPDAGAFYRRLFQTDAAAWQVEVVATGLEALEKLRTTACDVLVGRWRPAGKPVPEFFAAVAAAHPATARLIIAEALDREAVATLLGGSHQYLQSPVEVNLLRSTIWRVCSIQNATLDQRLTSLLGADYTVPTLPSLYFRVLRALDSPEASILEVGEIIAQDPAMVAKVLQLANSAFFGLARRIASPVEAVQILGIGKVRTLLLSIHAFSCFDASRMKSFPLSRLWNHSLATSQIAQKICRLERAGKEFTEEAQLACMLHGVGKVILASGDPDRYQRAVALARQRGGAIVEAEREIFGASHAEVGAFLLSRWGMPIAVIEAIALHHAPSRSVIDHFSPLAVTHVATCLETEKSAPVPGMEPTPLDRPYLERIGLLERLPLWREAVEEDERVAAGVC